ncbi:MAG: M4 family metallopeptidase [Myxococcota bacterium]
MGSTLLAAALVAQVAPVTPEPFASSGGVVHYERGFVRTVEGTLFLADDATGELPSYLELDGDDVLVQRTDERDRLGWRHLRFDRIRHSMPVEHDSIRVHANPAGVVVRIEADLSAVAGYSPVAPTLTPGAAIDRARQGYAGDLLFAPVVEPVLLGARNLEPPRAAFKVFIAYARPGGGEPYVRDVYVDSLSGRILWTVSRVFTQATTMNDTSLTGTEVIRVFVDQSQDAVILLDAQTIGSGGSAVTVDGRAGNAAYVTANTLTSFGDPTAVTVHQAVRRSIQFFRDEFDYNRWDLDTDPPSPGGTLFAIAHEGGDNAFFSEGTAGDSRVGVMAFGDGVTAFRELARCQDVATHELGHGIITATANLLYQFQSGALNEHYADIFGWLHDQEDDTIAEDCLGPGSTTPLRDLCDPGAVQFAQPSSMDEFVGGLENTLEDNFGGVHINSGIPNRAACLARDAIGAEALGRVWFQALRFHLGATSDFQDMVEATLTACAELALPGASCDSIQSAWSGVGLDVTVGRAPCPANATVSQGLCYCNDAYEPNSTRTGCTPVPREDCPANSTQVGTQCYCNEGFAPTASGDACVPEQLADCPPNSFREDGVCVCDECFEGKPDQNGLGCDPVPGCTVCDDPFARGGPQGCECIEGLTELCGPESRDYVANTNVGQLTGLECCRPDDPCGWENDGFCDCFGECGFDVADCGGSARVTEPICRAPVIGNCGNETWVGRCDGDILVYCDNETDPGRPFVNVLDCAGLDGRVCAYNETDRFFQCRRPVCTIPAEGVCDGNVARFCSGGTEQSLNCGEAGCSRFEFDGAVLNYCNPCGVNEIVVGGACQCAQGFVAGAGGCVAAGSGPESSAPIGEDGEGGCAGAVPSLWAILVAFVLLRSRRPGEGH